ncbi:MAG: hypothetical protein V7K57_01970 [Nostoc sp.]
MLSKLPKNIPYFAQEADFCDCPSQIAFSLSVNQKVFPKERSLI